MIKVSLISLGCAKNLVDSEIMVGHLHQAGMQVVPDAGQADVVIVNTCSFIDSSKEESIQHILEAHRHRGLHRQCRGQKLIVAGCMSQRFARELPGTLPEVDAFIGLDQITRVAPIIEEIYAKEGGRSGTPASFVTPRSTFIPDYDTPRFRLTPRHFAYVKIAEGCNHPCTFCIIPQIRGRHRSRTVASVVAEARRLVAEGVRELNLISQDTTFFGMDTWEERPGPRSPVDSHRGDALTTLLRELNGLEGDFWIRLLYTHPAHWSDELIRVIAECPKVARYVDMPLQHISDRMLDVMQRETSGAYIRDLVGRIRAGLPGIALRTTFIVGFPGETEADVEELCDFIRKTRFERLGAFDLKIFDEVGAMQVAGGLARDDVYFFHTGGEAARADPGSREGAPLAPLDGAAAGHRRKHQPRVRRKEAQGARRRTGCGPRRGRRARYRRPRLRAAPPVRRRIRLGADHRPPRVRPARAAAGRDAAGIQNRASGAVSSGW